MSRDYDLMKGKYWQRAWQLVEGCTPCSLGCEHCWSMAMAKRFHKWPDKVIVRPDRIDIPIKTRKPTVFAVWNDLFHENVPWQFIQTVYGIMAQTPQHIYLVLTKRPEWMRQAIGWIISGNKEYANLPNVWHGVTVCNQAEADAKIPELLKVPGKKWLSIEPMLGPIDVSCIKVGAEHSLYRANTLTGDGFDGHNIDAAVLGGETGPGARPMHPDWVRSVRDQCAASNVPFYFKQWGEYCAGCQLPDDAKSVSNGVLMDYLGDVFAEDGCSICSPDSVARLFHIGAKRAGRMLDGRTHDELAWRTADK